MTTLLTRKQVAEFLAITTKTVDKYCNQGKLPFIRIPAGKRFDPADIQSFIASRKFNQKSA